MRARIPYELASIDMAQNADGAHIICFELELGVAVGGDLLSGRLNVSVQEQPERIAGRTTACRTSSKTTREQETQRNA